MYEFITEGMSCSNCVNHVTEAVKSIDPKARVTIALPEQKVTVESEQDREILVRAIQEAGYPVHRVKSISERSH